MIRAKPKPAPSAPEAPAPDDDIVSADEVEEPDPPYESDQEEDPLFEVSEFTIWDTALFDI